MEQVATPGRWAFVVIDRKLPDVTRDGEPQSGAARVTRPRALEAVKRVEHRFQVWFGDPGAAITNLLHAVVTGDEPIGGVPCVKIEGRQDDVLVTIWVDRQTFLIRQLVGTRPVDEGLARALLAGGKTE